MNFYLTQDEPIEFLGEFPRGIPGKCGSIQMDLRVDQIEDDLSHNHIECYEALKRMLNSYQGYVRLMVVILLKDDPKGEGILQLQLTDRFNFLRDVRTSPGIENLTMRVTIYDLMQESTGDLISPPHQSICSKEMDILLDDAEKTCQDYHIQFPDGWYEMFQRRMDKITARITTRMIINAVLPAPPSVDLQPPPPSSNMSMYEKMYHDDRNKDVTIFVQDGKQVKCHKLFLSACSPVFDAMFQADMKESETCTVDMPDMTEEGVNSFLKYVYYQAKDEPNDNCGIAFELLYASHKYEVASDMEAVMRDMFLSKPPEWFEMDVTLKLFQLARVLPDGDALKMKAVQVLKINAAALQLSPTCKEMFQKNPEAAAELFQLAFASST